MILYIAEKPSLGRAVADVLPKPHQRGDGFITLGNGDVVSWCIGHLLEQAQPEAYHPDYKKWNLAHLPIVPTEWKLEVKANTKHQFSVLKKLIQKADVLVNLGDPDREGQMLVDEVINYCGLPKAKIAAVKRGLISDLNPEAVKKSLNNLRNNTDFIPLATSALARARADWLYGINMTRLCTLLGQQNGFNGVLSIGRVQTPVLGLVVKRDLEIENFVAKPFYELEVQLKTKQDYCFTAKWKPSEACAPYMDEDGRVLSRKLVENVASRVINQSGAITKYSAELKKQPPPLPYNLSALQIDAAKRYGLSAKQVLDICQQLYEQHRLITYPRSDCRYLPTNHFDEAHQVLAAIAKVNIGSASIIDSVSLKLKTKAWNDKNVSAHHAIIPTKKITNPKQLSANELNIYDLISRQYLMQFLPSFNYRQIQIEATIGGGVFVAQRREVQNLGWKIALHKTNDKEAAAEEFDSGKTPPLKEGDAVLCIDTTLLDKQTTPPKHFTDATLLSAMTGIARYVSNPEIRKILRETDGLGTEATRANIIELLFTRQFLQRTGKEIRATSVGRTLIQNLPESVSSPDMTAQWEAQLEAIHQKEMRYAHFMEPMTNTLNGLIATVSNVRFNGLNNQRRASVAAAR